MEFKHFESIIIEPPLKQILSRLGYVWNKTQISQQQRDRIDQEIGRAESLIELKAHAAALKIDKIMNDRAVLEKGITLQSAALVKLLDECEQVLFMGATAGSEVTLAIEKAAKGREQDMSRAVIFDAVASEMTDAALDWIMNLYNNDLRRQNKVLTKTRFSAGYGDLDISNQKIFYDILKMDRLQVKITEDYLLVPEKSVTAVAGIQSIRDQNQNG